MDNPGSREVRKFLQLLDVDIEQYLDNAGATDLLGRVNGLVAKRNAIAHGEVNSSATFGDVDSYITLVEDLSRYVDSAISDAVMRICELNTLPW